MLLICVACPHHVSGFLQATTTTHRQIRIIAAPSSQTVLADSPLFSGDDNISDSNEFVGFNPFQPGSKIISSGGGVGTFSNYERTQPPPATPGGQVSPRQMRMKELTTTLLACISDDESVAKVLQSNEEFLLEQLNNLDAVLEPDSIFTPNMSRSERFEQYRQVMEERIRTARAPVAKNVLRALQDFVSSKE